MRRFFGCVIVSFVFVVFVASSSAAVPGLSRLALGTSASIGTSGLSRYSYVLLSPSEWTYVAGIKAASPGTKVLMYASASEAVDYCSCPISYQSAAAHDVSNPSDPWLLYSSTGVSLTMPYYPSSHLVNVGSSSYQQQWASAISSQLRAGGFDGLYMDSVLGRISDTGTSPTLYPTDAAWEPAMRGFVATVGQSLKSQGFYVLANTYKSGPNDGSDDIAWWASLAPYVSGLQSEYWEESANAVTPFDTNPCCWTGHWLSWLGLADAAQQNGADFFTVDKGTATNTQLMTYLRGSYLLVWDGSGGAFTYAHEPDDGVESWDPAWTTDIGSPTGARYQVGVGWRRNYSSGTVVVNPDPSTAQSFSLGGSYQTLAGATVSSITVQPQSAAILTSAGATAPPPPAPGPSPSAPANTALPTISGTAQQGQNIYTSTGSWSGSPTGYSYQWKRCDSAGNNCAAIAGETFSGITLTSTDVGMTLRATVTATNATGSAAATTDQTGAVTATGAPAPAPAPAPSPTAPANTALPTLSGTAQQGQNIHTSTGSWSGSPTSYAYQWLRCDRTGASCVPISGETFYGIALSSAEFNHTVRVTVTASNAAGTAAATSSPSAVVKH
jgi:hypothetical protein